MRTDLLNCRPPRWAHPLGRIALALLLLVNGGCSASFWKERDPHAPVWIPASQITEKQLREQGRRYAKVRMTREALHARGIACEEPFMDGYLAVKSRQQKFNDSVALAVATPVKVVALGAVICAGVAAIAAVTFGMAYVDELPHMVEKAQ